MGRRHSQFQCFARVDAQLPRCGYWTQLYWSSFTAASGAGCILLFIVSRSNLSSDEIMQRKRRAAQGSLSAEESAEKSGLQQGALSVAQWSPAQWALFSKEELIDIGNTRYRNSSARYSNTIFCWASWRFFLISVPDGSPRTALSSTGNWENE